MKWSEKTYLIIKEKRLKFYCDFFFDKWKLTLCNKWMNEIYPDNYFFFKYLLWLLINTINYDCKPNVWIGEEEIRGIKRRNFQNHRNSL